jgi:hypothetical protein
MSNNTNPQI